MLRRPSARLAARVATGWRSVHGGQLPEPTWRPGRAAPSSTTHTRTVRLTRHLPWPGISPSAFGRHGRAVSCSRLWLRGSAPFAHAPYRERRARLRRPRTRPSQVHSYANTKMAKLISPAVMYLFAVSLTHRKFRLHYSWSSRIPILLIVMQSGFWQNASFDMELFELPLSHSITTYNIVSTTLSISVLGWPT